MSLINNNWKYIKARSEWNRFLEKDLKMAKQRLKEEMEENAAIKPNAFHWGNRTEGISRKAKKHLKIVRILTL